MRWLLLTTVVFGGCASAPATTSHPITTTTSSTTTSAPPLPLVESVLREWEPATRCPIASAAGEFDEYPNGGLRSFWCHRPARASLSLLRALSKTRVFANGPHTDDLALTSPTDFGHYDPTFVRWLTASVPSRESSARSATQAAYEAKLSPLAEALFHALQKIEREKACFTSERDAYAAELAKKTLPPDYHHRWFFFMNPWFCEKRVASEFYYENGFDGGTTGKVATSVVSFWMRRAVDGTFEEFAAGLRRLLASYEPDLLTAEWRPPDRASIGRAIDAGTKAASTCRDPKAPLERLLVALTMGADGHVEAWIKSPAVRGTPQARCIERAFAAQKITPFEGRDLPFTRTLPLR